MLFLLDALQRINRLRRLIEYRVMVDASRFANQAREHIAILDPAEAPGSNAERKLQSLEDTAARSIQASAAGHEFELHF